MATICNTCHRSSNLYLLLGLASSVVIIDTWSMLDIHKHKHISILCYNYYKIQIFLSHKISLVLNSVLLILPEPNMSDL